MGLKILIDMNLSPEWASFLASHGWPAIHWSQVGDPRATDREIMDWAVAHSHVVFTHDLDFGTALALTHEVGPSVLQFRGRDVLPNDVGSLLIAAIRQHESDLSLGAIVVIEENRCRVRVLPIH